MRIFKLYYNPFEGKTELSYVKNSGADKISLDCIGNGKESRLPEWVDQFFPELFEKFALGDSECLVKFYGTPGNFEDLEDALNVFRTENPTANITVEHENRESKNLDTRLGDLKTLFDRMQSESPYPELRDDEREKKELPPLRPGFEKALSAEFEISVIATMSSGKSTLINAILGRELLPALNQATTNKIARIKDIDDAESFTVRGLRKSGQTYEEAYPSGPASLEVMKDLASRDDVELIELEGDIPGIDSRQMKLVLSDTPGPNNSRTTDHAKHIDDLINADYKPMIMYILNATQLEIVDDHNLLSRISAAMKESGKQGKDRFLFVINKSDALDPEKGEPVEKMISNSHDYLAKFGINNARIFPVSAQLAKLVRMYQNGFPITSSKDRGALNEDKPRFIEMKAMHFSDFVSLSPSCKKAQEIELQNAVTRGDENAQTLVYSGIRAIEIAINEYLDKYALSAKISQAVAVFKKIVDGLHLAEQTQEALAKDTEKREQTVRLLEKAIAAIEKGDKAKELIDKFDAQIRGKQKELVKKIEGLAEAVLRFFGEQEASFPNTDMGVEAANKLVNKTCKLIELQLKTLVSDIARLMNKELFKQANEYIAQYRSYAKSLFEDTGDYQLNTALDLVGVSLPDNPHDLLDRLIETRTWETKEEDNITGLGIRRFLGKIFGNDEWGYKYVSHSKNVVNMGNLFRTKIQPIENEFLETIESGKTEAKRKCADLAKYIKEQIGKLDNELKRRAGEQRALLSEQGKLEAAIKENEGKKAWLEQFRKELDAVLEI
jgi:predicted GTPase